MSNINLSYKDAGVDIDAGDQLVERIKTIAKATRRPEVMGGLGGFSALFDLPLDRYKHPVLVSTTDGVGTKLKLAITTGQHDGIGIDLVAMCVNDLIVCGAEPLFFLDYYATGKLNVDVAEAVIKGIGAGCQQAGAALVGGETAEMPGMYQAEDYDLAGFCVGIVEKDRIIDGSKVQAGDALIGLASSGPHSNGYSLIRKIIEARQVELDAALTKTLLAPTRIYVKTILGLLQTEPVHAIAHITGGGIKENLARVIPNGCQAVVQRGKWQQPEVFNWLQQQGGVNDDEMMRTFNCGVGLILAVPAARASAIVAYLQNQGENCWTIGQIETAPATATHKVMITS